MNFDIQFSGHRGRTFVVRAAFAAFSLAALAGCNAQLPIGVSDAPHGAARHEATRSIAAPLASPITWPTFATLSRYHHAGVELGQGRALVCGGKDNTEVYPPNCELLTSDGNTLTSAVYPLPGDPFSQGRISLTLTLLPTGGVLLAGGRPGNNNLDLDARASVPISNWLPDALNPNQNWLPNETMVIAREEHTATLLGTSVVVVGGYNRLTNVVEQMEVRTDTGAAAASWNAVGSSGQRTHHTATLLKIADTGSAARVLVLGGYDAAGDCLSSGFIFSLANGVQPITPMPSPRADHTTTLLNDGDLLVVGGESAEGNATAGSYLSDALLYNPSTDTWSAASAAMGTQPAARKYHSAAALGEYVIIAGGEGPGALDVKSGQALQSVQSYDWKHNTWSDLRSLTEGREHFQLLRLGETQLVASGGWRANGSDAPPSSELITLGALGHASTDATVCACGHAADGVCCDSDCNGACERCNGSGVCQPVIGTPVAGHPSCDGHLLCDALGECPVQCDPTDSCAAGYFCDAGACAPEKEIGATCVLSSECALGAPCVDGVCCKSLCGGACESCNQAPNPGICLPLGNGTCAHCNVSECNGYQCDRQTDECRHLCQKSVDCAGGYYCHPLDHRCVLAVPFPAADLPACAFGTSRTGDRGLAAAGALCLLLAARRRERTQRRAAPPMS